jgi:hypothetical protein
VSPTSLRSASTRTAGWAVLALLLVVQVLVLYLPSGVGEPPFRHADKLVHVAVFAAPAAVAALLAAGPWVLAVLVGHALVSEPLQGWVTTGRVADVWDAVAGLVGIVLGVLVVSVWTGRGESR